MKVRRSAYLENLYSPLRNLNKPSFSSSFVSTLLHNYLQSLKKTIEKLGSLVIRISDREELDEEVSQLRDLLTSLDAHLRTCKEYAFLLKPSLNREIEALFSSCLESISQLKTSLNTLNVNSFITLLKTILSESSKILSFLEEIYREPNPITSEMLKLVEKSSFLSPIQKELEMIKKNYFSVQSEKRALQKRLEEVQNTLSKETSKNIDLISEIDRLNQELEVCRDNLSKLRVEYSKRSIKNVEEVLKNLKRSVEELKKENDELKLIIRFMRSHYFSRKSSK